MIVDCKCKVVMRMQKMTIEYGETFGMRRATRCHLVALLVSLLAMGVSGAQSKLKVAACKPGQAPYVVVQENGNLSGFDIGECRFPSVDDVVPLIYLGNMMGLQIYGAKPTVFSSEGCRRR
jgi:hypothetical protein